MLLNPVILFSNKIFFWRNLMPYKDRAIDINGENLNVINVWDSLCVYLNAVIKVTWEDRVRRHLLIYHFILSNTFNRHIICMSESHNLLSSYTQNWNVSLSSIEHGFWAHFRYICEQCKLSLLYIQLTK